MSLHRLLAFWLFAVAACSAFAESDRFALFIGNSAYEHLDPLKNPASDAELLAATLKELNFDVTVATDLTKSGMERSLLDFRRKVVPGAVVMVFYAGHGIQYDGQNYLVPIDADFEDIADLPLVTMPVQQLLSQVQSMQSETAILVLDACRNNPLYSGRGAVLSSRSVGGGDRGLARVSSGQTGTLIAFSTGPGAVALDGTGENSPYSLALSQELLSPGKTIEQVFKSTRARVVETTAGRQIPWENSSLVSSLVLTPTENETTAPKTEETATPCDLAAAHPSDPGRIGPAVDYRNLDPQIAIPACEAAVSDFPETARFKALLARALDKARQGEAAVEYNEQAMSQGYIAAWHNMGNLYAKGLGVPKDLSKALELWTYAAERGHAEDQSNVGRAYLKGRGTDIDYEKARYWFEKAADQNWTAAINWLGLMALNGQGIEQNEDLAFSYFQRASNLGFRHAMVNLGNSYRLGQGTEQDVQRAIRLYQQAAVLKTPSAYRMLAQMAEDEASAELTQVDSAFWFSLAARHGDEVAMEGLARVRARLDDSDIQELEERLLAWDEQDFG